MKRLYTTDGVPIPIPPDEPVDQYPDCPAYFEFVAEESAEDYQRERDGDI